MDYRKFKLGVGPMSKLVVNLCLAYSEQYQFPLMFIASRNQVDYDSGYAFTTTELVDYIRNSKHYDPDRILICRDHCGPYFSDLDSGLELEDALNRCMKTIEMDCNNDFDLIHIDVSRVQSDQQYNVAKQLFDYAQSIKTDMAFEFGTEDNTGTDLQDNQDKLLQQLEFVETYKPNIKFIVSQTGSLTKLTQVGSFNVADNTQTATLIHESGLLFKEHNADYLRQSDIALRKAAGVDAINIAPQLGYVQSSVMLEYKTPYTDSFYTDVLDSQYWKKWVTPSVTDNDIKFMTSAHYCYDYPNGKALMHNLLKNSDFMQTLMLRMYNALDEYRIGYEL